MNNIDKTMQEKMKAELLELQNLESTGTITDDQKTRLTELLAWEREEADRIAALDKIKKDNESLLNQKEHFRTKFEKEEAARIAAEKLAKERGSSETPRALEVEDFIDISASLEGLDQREKEYLANQHKLTGKSLADIRKDENFLLWQSAYQQKVEKEKLTLKPNSTQITENAPSNLEQRIQNAGSMAEKEKLLIEAGLYTPPKRRSDSTKIGNFN